MADFSELIIKRRAIRDFEDKVVPLDVIKAIIKDSCLAPSAGNGQPWRFVIIQNKNLIKKLSDECKKNLLSDIEKSPDSPAKKFEDNYRNPHVNIFYNAPCLVYIFGPKNLFTLQADCALAASYFMFSAIEKELGTCWIGQGRHIRDHETLNQIGIPEDSQIVAPIIVGYPKKVPAETVRNEPKILNVIP